MKIVVRPNEGRDKGCLGNGKEQIDTKTINEVLGKLGVVDRYDRIEATSDERVG